MIAEALNRKPQPRLLRALARHIEKNVPDTEFDMDHFCGTARCAFGHAPEVPAIRKMGLRIVGKGLEMGLRLRKKDDIAIARTLYSDVVDFDCISNFRRAEWVFGITKDEAWQVFGCGGTAEKVAERLRRLASKYDKKPA